LIKPDSEPIVYLQRGARAKIKKVENTARKNYNNDSQCHQIFEESYRVIS